MKKLILYLFITFSSFIAGWFWGSAYNIFKIFILPMSNKSNHQVIPLPPSEENIFKLEVQNFVLSRSNLGMLWVAQGEVKNIYFDKLENIIVIVSFYDNQNNFIATEETFISITNLFPNQTSPFKVSVSYNPKIELAKVQFKHALGEPILTKYKNHKYPPPPSP